ncbi:MAG TPA: hypothetical protein VKZ88_06400 [Fibrobacteria bacterium]|nr:hypothetical protein [Fibrobacteria bacterium]
MNGPSGMHRRTRPVRHLARHLVGHLAGHLAVGLLTAITRMPLVLTRSIGTFLLPAYLPFRRRTRAKLARHCPGVSPFRYYRTRLHLALLSARHIRNRPDGCRHVAENATLLTEALAQGRPVVLLGWHQGPVELLHRIPAMHLDRIGKRTGVKRGLSLLTASAFSAPLADWMTSGREAGRTAPTRVIRPGDMLALRSWARSRGVLAVMVDQVPGTPEDTLVPGPGLPALPWPRRLLDWIGTQDPVFLAVTARWHPAHAHGLDRIVFRYHALTADAPSPVGLKVAIGHLMQAALRAAPEQYNWSYGKIGTAETS